MKKDTNEMKVRIALPNLIVIKKHYYKSILGPCPHYVGRITISTRWVCQNLPSGALSSFQKYR